MRANPNDTFAVRPSQFVKSGSAVTVTIGRNVGTEPMRRPQWLKFQEQVVDQLSALVRPNLTFTYHGQGEWDGVDEESACIVLADTTYSAANEHVESVLGKLAAEYGQDAIAWSAGPNHLATPAR